MNDEIKPSLVAQVEYRKPFLTREKRIVPTDDGGRVTISNIVNVPLSCGTVARIDQDDYNAIMEQGFSDQWWLHSNGRNRAYVRTTRFGEPGVTATVARLVASGRSGTRVRYFNCDPLDLRRSNLKVGSGVSTGYEAKAMAEDVS